MIRIAPMKPPIAMGKMNSGNRKKPALLVNPLGGGDSAHPASRLIRLMSDWLQINHSVLVALPVLVVSHLIKWWWMSRYQAITAAVHSKGSDFHPVVVTVLIKSWWR
jgi:hypothetical protein